MRGGARAGAGRPRKDIIRITFYLDGKNKDFFDSIDEKGISKKINKIFEMAEKSVNA